MHGDGLKIVTGLPPLLFAALLLPPLLPPATGETKARAEILRICLAAMAASLLFALIVACV